MEPSEHRSSVRIGAGPDGSLTYFVELPPEDLPPVHRRDLERAWYAARGAALAQRWGVARFFRFQRPDGSYGDLALADRDACCWADAVDGMVGLRNSYGLMSEDVHPATKELWGNFPQTYSMAGLILSALRLSKSWEDRYWRGSS